MSAADILKSMKCAPKLSKSTYNRWSVHFQDTLSLFEIEDYLLQVKFPEENSKTTESSIHKASKDPAESSHLASSDTLKQDRNIRVAISQLVPDIVFHLVGPSFTAKQCWDNLRDFYCPSSGEDVDDLLFQSAIASIRASQTVYRDLHPTPMIAFLNNEKGGNPSSPPAASKKKTCAYCKRRGHLRESCFLWMDTPDGSKWASKNPEKAKKARTIQEKLKRRKSKSKAKIEMLNESTEGVHEGAWIMEEPVLVSEDYQKSDNVVLDTGATHHIFHDRSMFHHISSTNKSISTASGQLIPVSGVGSVKFRVFIHGEGKASKIIEMENVWYVPTCTRNLVSGVQLLSKGFEIRSLNGGMSVLSSSGEVIATARLREGLLCFNTSPEPTYHFPKGKSDTLSSYNVQTSPTEILHHKFGRVGPRLLENIKISEFKPSIVKAGEEDDFHINEKDLRTCDVCNRCKQVEKINRGPQTKSPTKLELIHSDTWDNSLSDVPYYFRTYKERKELQTSEKIKAMRFDGGTEYKTISFDGISKQICAPYTQHQNGVSERLNRTLITMARCMLSHARLPLHFWDAAVLTACYLRNRLPIHQNRLTPFEVMNGRPPIISHPKVWGCVCYALIDKNDPQRYKLKETSLKGIFVGYCESITQYQVYIPSKLGRNKTIISANVRFLEESFWDWDEPLRQTLSEEILPLGDYSTLIPEINTDSSIDSDLEMDTFDTETIIQPQLLASPTRGTPVGEAREAYSEAEEVPVARDDEVSRENIGQRNTDTLLGIENILSAEEAANTPNVSGPSETQDIFPPLETPQNPNLRRSSRSRKPIEPRSARRPRPHALHIGNGRPIPKDFQDAINGPDRAKWQTAINEELDSLRVKKVFTPIIHVPHGRKTVGSRWVFAVKSNGRYKARLVGQGFSQVYGINYFDTYSPTLRMDSLRILLAIGAFYDWEIHQIDVKTAYLEGDLEEEVYMKCPEGNQGTNFVRVDKALYGLKQSGQAWYKKLDAKLSLLNFNQSISDQCIYIHPKLQIVIGVYADDLVVCGKVLKQVVKTKQQLSSHIPIKDLGEIDVIIGWKITRERSTRTLRISQVHYITDKVECFSLQDTKVYKSPLDGYDGILPGRENESPADESAYASAVWSLGYASHSTRPDISFTVSQLGKYNSCPVVRHWNSVCRVFRNLRGTADYSVTYCFGPLFSEPLQSAKIVMYSDSDYAGDVVTRHSVSGYVVMLGGGPVCWQSKQQKSVSTSIAEAEYVALSEAAKQAVWVNRLLGELHVGDAITNASGSLILSDNQSALSIAGGTNSAKTKHIDVACHFVRECIEEKKIQVKYIPTNMMLADLLTKPLSHSKARPLCYELFQLE
ncbi:hypothetical protein K3495_g2750 [Podosphaera aphanis]|nr:hypothetical protein K3495_g2750 [Podosphaera aphanis]